MFIRHDENSVKQKFFYIFFNFFSYFVWLYIFSSYICGTN